MVLRAELKPLRTGSRQSYLQAKEQAPMLPSSEMTLNRDDLEDRVGRALEELLRHDKFLLQNDANERSITHKFAEYLEAQFPGWNVDCEYNRDGYEPKRLNLPPRDTSADDVNAVTVFPDIIVHHRGTPENLLVIEAKKSTSRDTDAWDRLKLMRFKDELQYRFAAFVMFYTGTAKADARVDWI